MFSPAGWRSGVIGVKTMERKKISLVATARRARGYAVLYKIKNGEVDLLYLTDQSRMNV